MANIPPQLVGDSAEFHALLDWVSDIASVDLPILVLGEAGTGKAQIASRLHFLSPRWEQSYFGINCAAYSEEDLISYIYGDDDRTALLDRADGGTLFFDNIEHLSIPMLERLARLVEYGDFRPSDDQDSQTVDIRYIISADPSVIAKSERREQLSTFLDRLSTDVVNIPPLRDRKADIAPLMLHFGRKTASILGAEQFPGLTAEALEALMDYDWPGNMRELRHVIERSTARAFLSDETLTQPISNIIFNPFVRAFRQKEPNAELPDRAMEDLESAPAAKNFTERILKFERSLINEAMQAHNHHQGKASEYLGLTYHSFRGLLRKHGLKK
ncbi:MAG: sigma 54-interacting transcriptional regulator [Hellea sp.]|nr:sigma 54-interacting transcriptional regulator [Hellea sp.]